MGLHYYGYVRKYELCCSTSAQTSYRVFSLNGREDESVSVGVGCVDRPGLNRPSSKHGVEQSAKHVDGSGDVKHSLPFLYSVLEDNQHRNG